jgi:hypothetical protein
VLRRAVFAAAAALVAGSGLALYLDGRVPAAWTPVSAYEPAALLEALVSVDGRGVVDLAQLKARHAALERYVASLHGARVDSFATADDRVAFWLNAAHGLVLLELLDARDGDATQLSRHWRTWPVAGELHSRASIERRFLAEAADPRIWLALFTGARGSGVLDGAPFDGAILDAQLNDAARRFVRRPEVLRVEGNVVKLADVFHAHEVEFLAALPPERKQLLQIVWAFLPDDCGGALGCVSRGDLDHACGSHFDRCSISWLPADPSLAVMR